MVEFIERYQIFVRNMRQLVVKLLNILKCKSQVNQTVGRVRLRQVDLYLNCGQPIVGSVIQGDWGADFGQVVIGRTSMAVLEQVLEQAEVVLAELFAVDLLRVVEELAGRTAGGRIARYDRDQSLQK